MSRHNISGEINDLIYKPINFILNCSTKSSVTVISCVMINHGSTMLRLVTPVDTEKPPISWPNDLINEANRSHNNCFW